MSPIRERTQVGIVGGGPAGLLLSHLLAGAGIDSHLIELRSRDHCEARQRAGVIEQGSADLLRSAGLGERMDREGLVHGGIYLQFSGDRLAGSAVGLAVLGALLGTFLWARRQGLTPHRGRHRN